jgi:hypothetical protein
MSEIEEELELELESSSPKDHHPMSIWVAPEEEKRRMYCVEFASSDWGFKGKEALINANLLEEYISEGKVPPLGDKSELTSIKAARK